MMVSKTIPWVLVSSIFLGVSPVQASLQSHCAVAYALASQKLDDSLVHKILKLGELGHTAEALGVIKALTQVGVAGSVGGGIAAAGSLIIEDRIQRTDVMGQILDETVMGKREVGALSKFEEDVQKQLMKRHSPLVQGDQLKFLDGRIQNQIRTVDVENGLCTLTAVDKNGQQKPKLNYDRNKLLKVVVKDLLIQSAALSEDSHAEIDAPSPASSAENSDVDSKPVSRAEFNAAVQALQSENKDLRAILDVLVKGLNAKAEAVTGAQPEAANKDSSVASNAPKGGATK